MRERTLRKAQEDPRAPCARDSVQCRHQPVIPDRSHHSSKPGSLGQLVRAADGTSNNLIEADAASSNADFLNKMRIALREAKESKACLAKIRLGPLANAPRVEALGLEDEADELCAVYATIVMNTEKRMAQEAVSRRRRRNSQWGNGQ